MTKLRLQAILASSSGRSRHTRVALFAWLTLGVTESLANGLIAPTEAVRLLFNADNCLWVRKRLGRMADEIMSRGVQLPDLFDALPAEEAHREFRHELVAMRGLCMKPVDRGKLVA